VHDDDYNIGKSTLLAAISKVILTANNQLQNAPVITMESTAELEKMIKKRIVEGSFDDVIRIKDTTEDFKPKPKVELDHEKSKLSLSEVYEKEVCSSHSFFFFIHKIMHNVI
jgi:U3 small nucleolar ribonucleoprotein component